ncbi:MAG: plastocyanin/azurin family copper-binding protein [Solirubrobacteraceae bacterium]
MAPASLTSRVLALVACCALAGGLAACSSDDPPEHADLVAGKKAFAKNCSSCHVLARANARGTQGPNLDEAFRRALSDGFGRGTIRGAVHSQIIHPAVVPKKSPSYMPPNLVRGRLAEDVAAYVAASVALPGKDEGLLAVAVPAAGSGKPVAAKGGKLLLPADPNGQLAYITKIATAPTGQLTIESKNDASIPHDIALEGGGVNAKGKTVQGGGISSISVSVKAGKYQFFCTITGHRAAGMEGTLTVK